MGDVIHCRAIVVSVSLCRAMIHRLFDFTRNFTSQRHIIMSVLYERTATLFYAPSYYVLLSKLM